MVYCGKPSRGCQMCRTRRIKCDETKPTCLQCQKSRRQCPGYKDDFDLVFRNETQATERRAKRATTASKKANTQIAQARQRQQQETTLSFPDYGFRGNSPSAFSTVSSMSETSPVTAMFSPMTDYSSLPMISSSIPGQIDTSFESQAIHFFLSNWVLLPQQGTSRGYLDFLLPLLRTSPPDSHLSLTFSAVGLAALGNRASPGMNSKGLLPYAAQKYEKALKRTNEALRDPVLAKQDSTLASVLLLGLFEQITSCRSNLMGWGSHVDGAVALIKMRGKKQLRTAVGKGLFIAVRTQMVVNCTSSSKAPLIGTEFWTTDAMKDPYGQDITRLNLLVAELRADVNKTMTMAPRTAANMEKVLNHMRQAQSLEEKFKKWRTTLPPDWLVKTAYWEGDGEPEGTEADWALYPGEIHSYQDIWQASVWNMSHVSRLFLSGIVVRCAAWICSPEDYRETPEYATAVSVASEMLAKIIAVIPFLLGWGLRDNGSKKEVGQVDNGDFAVGGGGFGAQKALPRALGGFFALWPLFTVACSDYVNESQRRWAIGRLRWITEEMGVNQAGVLSQFQLRLPSMVIKRDGMGISLPNARDMAKHSGPTANLPPAARPTTMEKINHGPGGVKVKFDDSSPRHSRANSVASTMANNQTSTSFNMTNQQDQHQQSFSQQQPLTHNQGQYNSQQYTDEANSQYAASPQTYSSPEHQGQVEAQNSTMYSNMASYPQAQNSQYYQDQAQYTSPNSYQQISNAGSPPTYSATTDINPTANRISTTQYQPEPPRTRMENHRNQMDLAGKLDRFISMTSGSEGGQSTGNSPNHNYNNSPSPPVYSNQEQFDVTSPMNSQQTYNTSTTNFDNSGIGNYNFDAGNSVDFKMGGSNHGMMIQQPYNSGGPISQQNHGLQEYSQPNHWTGTNPPQVSRSNSNVTARDANTASMNRLNWEIEMVGQEVKRGNESERRHLQAHFRELGRQRMM